MVQGLVERIDEDPVQDPLLAWHKAVAPRTVASMTWEPPSRLKDDRLAPGAARVIWHKDRDTFIAARRPLPVHGIADAVVIGLATSRVYSWRAGWQPVEDAVKVHVRAGNYNTKLPGSAAIAVVPRHGLLITFWEEAIWWDLNRAADWLEALSHDQAQTQRLDPIEFPALIDALVEAIQ